MSGYYPNAMEEHWIDGAAGQLFVRHWPAIGENTATLIICHGFSAYGGHYARAAEIFAQRGFAITAPDLRWRGRSDGDRYNIETIADYVSDLSRSIDFARSLMPELPVFLHGHGAGGVTALTYAIEHQNSIAGLICDSFAYRVFPPDRPSFKVTDFSRDPAWIEHLEQDPLVQVEVQPVQTVAALAHAAGRLRENFGNLTLPVLILHGTADKVANADGSREFFGASGSSDKTLKLYAGHYHDLLNDLDRDCVTNDIGNWIARRLPARPTTSSVAA